MGFFSGLPFIILHLLIFIVPAGIVAYFVISLVRFLSARRHRRDGYFTFIPEHMQARTVNLIVSAVLLGLMVTAMIVFVFYFARSLAYM